MKRLTCAVSGSAWQRQPSDLFTGEAGIHGHVGHPLSLEDGMNTFLKQMSVTFRRDGDTKRPRVNKPDSKLDKEQKSSGRYYYSG